MKIKVNSSTNIFEVPEEHLEVKGKWLYNTVTKSFEGLDGDLGIFVLKHDNGKMYEHRGTIDGYTCSGRVKFRGNETVYEGITNLRIEHISVIIGHEDSVVEYSLKFE